MKPLIVVQGAIVGALVAVIFAVTVIAISPVPRQVIACQEDEVIVGQGDFHANGYWDRYVCVNVEDVNPPTTWREPVWFPTPSPR